HGYSALKAGLAFLPASFGIMLFAGIGSKLIQKTGPLPLIAYGLLAVAGGLAWLSRITLHSTYLVHILAPMLLLASGMGFAFVSIFPTALARVPKEIAGLGSAMVNVAQQVGGTLGLSVLVTVSATAMNTRLHSLLAAAGSAASQPSVAKVAAAVAAIHGWDVAFLVGSAIALAGLVVALVFIRPPRAEELAGLAPEFSV
nr:MFS transporter [Actinomycetota bacterium]